MNWGGGSESGERDLVTEAEVRRREIWKSYIAIDFEDAGRWSQSKECRRPWKLVKAADAPSEPPRGAISANTLILAWGNWLWTWPPGTVVQLLSRVQLFSTLWSAAHQPSLSFTVSWSLLKLLSIKLMMPSNHLILCCPLSSCPQSFPASGSFPMSCFFVSDGQSIGASASVPTVNTQGWFPLELTGLISLLFKGLSRAFSSTTTQKHQFFSAQPSLWSSSHIHTWLLEKP